MDEGVKVVRGTKEAQDAAKVAEAEKKLAAKDGRTAGAKYVPPAPKKTVTAGAKPETAYAGDENKSDADLIAIVCLFAGTLAVLAAPVACQDLYLRG